MVSRPRPPNRREATAVVAGGLAGAVVLGAILRAGGGAPAIQRFAGLVGATGSAAGWAGVVGAALLFAAGFGAFFTATASPFVGLLFAGTRRSRRFRRLLTPVLRRAPYRASALTLGLAYGLVVGVAFGAVAMPAWERALGGEAALPHLDPVVLGAWVASGGCVGLVYAVVTERTAG